MDYKFINNTFDIDTQILPQSNKINSYLLKNSSDEVYKALDFINSSDKFLYIHGFIGAGKRQFIDYICEFIDNDVLKLEYNCGKATVCDDILLDFIDTIEHTDLFKTSSLNAKITTLNIKFQKLISSIKKPILIIIHSYDEIQDENIKYIKELLTNLLKEDNIKLIISTRAIQLSILENVPNYHKIFLKAFSKDIFKEYLISNNIIASDITYDDFYKYTRGYYYYAALTIKIIQALNINLNEFLERFNNSNMNIDTYIRLQYIDLIPNIIKNFFWFIRTIRHGINFNALAALELYDDFTIEYLKTNLIIHISNETIHVHNYFLQQIDLQLPKKTEIKLHKYIINIYETQLKAPIKDRTVLISRQAMRAEIDYHTNKIKELETNIDVNNIENISEQNIEKQKETISQQKDTQTKTLSEQIKSAKNLINDKNYTQAIEAFHNIIEHPDIDLYTLTETRLNLAKLYKNISNYKMSEHYYDIVETYYKQHNEVINLNYLYYDMTDLYFKMYKTDRAIETIKKVVYSVDTPQSLLVAACTLLGDLCSNTNNSHDAYIYYKKAIESLNENVNNDILANLYFKFGLANDDKNQIEQAFDYYNKCIAIQDQNPYRALAYSNLASCYFDNESYDEAKNCFQKAYEIEKQNNNFEGIYYTALQLAKLLQRENSLDALSYLIEAKKSAEFINDEYYILETTVALGDFYYNNKETYKDALKEYFKAQILAQKISNEIDITKITSRIKDMKLRMKPNDFEQIEKNYAI